MSAPLHILFEKCVQQTPEAIALIHESFTLSYAKLNKKASQLASYLSAQGVVPGSFVHIFLPRSHDLIIALLAVLKCGAAYVPLETGYPKKRLKFLFKDLQSDCVITQKEMQTLLPETHSPLIFIDQLNLSNETIFKSHPSALNDTCMVLYTSGSTGQPKGVLLHHSGISNRLIWEQKNEPYGSNEVILQHASFSFDFAQWEIFTALLNSACLVLTRKVFSYESNYLTQLIQQHNITIMGSVPSLLSLLIEDADFKNCTSLKRVVAGGEVLTNEFQNRFFKKSNADLINIYGPTETSISVLHWHCQRNQNDKKVPIGFAIADMELYLLDDQLKPVKQGDEGELFISGAGVANGYHNRDLLNKDRFISSLNITDSSKKIYRTGDIARQREDGAFEYIGRKDNQIKIRGLRVELEEVEHVLNSHAAIKECLITAPKNDTGNQKLIAWCVLDASQKNINEKDLRKYMRQSLPEYMVPTLFNTLEQFPLTPNGKIDRKALSLKTTTQSPLESLTPTETLIHELWQDILGTEIKGINANFFESGGDSLACLDLSVRIEKQTGLRFSISLLYQANTIKEQASRLENGDIDEPFASISNINTGKKKSDTTLILVSAIGGNLAHITELRNHLSDYPILGISSPVLINSDSIIKDIATSQCEALSNHSINGKVIVAGFSVGGLIAHELCQQLSKKSINVAHLILMDTGIPAMITQLEKSNLSLTQRFSNIWLSIKSRNISDTIKFFKEGIAKRRHRKNRLKNKPEIIARLINKRKARLRTLGFKAVEQHQLQNYQGNVTLIRARDQATFSSLDKSLGWNNYVQGKLKLKSVSGSHASMLREPNIAEVAAIIKQILIQ